MVWIKIIGFIAAILTTGAFVPQAWKTWKTKSTEDLSPIMFILFCLGIFLWLLYGLAKNDLPMILANSVTICLAGIILFYILSPLKTKKITHIGLWVNNLEYMKKFYTDNLNCKTGKIYVNQTTGFTSYFLSFSSGVRLELMSQASGNLEPVKWGHIALSVGSKKNVDNLTDKLKTKGVKIIQMPRTTGDGYYESIIEDPEGNLLEITI
jgi:lactoylglutathione lyase